MKSILISIRPKWCELIASGKKTIEIRKTKPKLDVPFKCYIYCTKPKNFFAYTHGLYTSNEYLHLYHEKIIMSDGFELCCEDDYETACQVLNGKVIGEFICNSIIPISIYYSDESNRIANREFPFTCLTDKEIMNYLGNGVEGYGWHISELKIYDKPKELSEFHTYGYENDYECYSNTCGNGFPICFNEDSYKIQRPPQSWCYVEELP